MSKNEVRLWTATAIFDFLSFLGTGGSTVVSPTDEPFQHAHPPAQNDWKSNKARLTDELRSQIVKECCEDLISPAELASRHGVNVVQIRKIVKDAGKKLPTKYKVTSSKNIRFVKALNTS